MHILNGLKKAFYVGTVGVSVILSGKILQTVFSLFLTSDVTAVESNLLSVNLFSLHHNLPSSPLFSNGRSKKGRWGDGWIWMWGQGCVRVTEGYIQASVT